MTIASRTLATSPANLLALWRMNEASGSDVLDSSGNSYDGTYYGATLAALTGPDGESAPSFDGVNDYADVYSAGLSGAFDGSEGTFLCWFKVSGAGVWSDGVLRVIGVFYVNASNRLYIAKNTTSNEVIAVYVAGGTSKQVTSTLSDTGRNCVALTWSDTADEMKFYVNGAQVGSTQTGLGTWSGSITNVKLSRAAASSANFWSGGLALAAVWDTALTESQLDHIVNGYEYTTPDAEIYAYIDFDQDGFTIDDRVTVRDGSASLGLLGLDGRVAEVGQLTLTVDNSTREYSPDNTGSSIYGRIKPKTPVKLTGVGYSGEVDLWTGKITAVAVSPQRYGDRYATITAECTLREYQDLRDIILPLQTDAIADDLLRLVDAAVWQSAAATGSLAFWDIADTNDTITIGNKTYTLKLASGGVPANDGEVGLFTDRYNTYSTANAAKHYYIDDTIENLAAAINHDYGWPNIFGNNTAYKDATPRHTQVVASFDHVAFGWPLSEADAYLYLANSGAGSYTKLACRITLAEDTIPNVSAIQLPLEKVGVPTGTLTVAIYHGGGDGFATSVLVDANATTTRAESSLPPSTNPDTMITFTFPGSFTVPPNAILVVSTNRAPHASNYVQWAAEGTGSSDRGRASTYASAWSSSSSNLCFWCPGTLTIDANARGSWANSLDLISGAAEIIALDSTLTGGAQPSTITPSYETGARTFDYAGDSWGEAVNGMTVIQEITESEYGFFAIDRSGNPVFKNTDYWFKAHTLPAVTLDNTQSDFSARYTLDDIKNQWAIEYRERTLVEGVQIGAGVRVIKLLPGAIDGYDGGRWASHKDRVSTEGFTRIVTMSTVDGDTGNPSGVYAVDPPVRGTHYTIYTKPRKDLGVEITNDTHLKWSWAIKGAGVQFRVTNTAPFKLFVHDLQPTGDVLGYSQPSEFYIEDSTSIATYGQSPGSYTLWLPTGEDFARSLGDYLLALWKDPHTVVETVTYDLVEYASDTTHLFDIDLFDVLDVSEYQHAFSGKLMVVGIEYGFDVASLTTITFHVRQLDPYEYLILDDATYGEIDAYSVAL